jgi:hypothetical protein
VVFEVAAVALAPFARHGAKPSLVLLQIALQKYQGGFAAAE